MCIYKCRKFKKFYGFAAQCFPFPPKRTFKLLGHCVPIWSLKVSNHCRLLIWIRWKRPDCSGYKLDGNIVQNTDITGSFMTEDFME
jgi:hypothetical protein